MACMSDSLCQDKLLNHSTNQRMSRKIFLLLLLTLTVPVVYAQKSTAKKPKLVVGIVVDQMRQEYLHRFYPKYGEGGFKRLMRDGFECKNAHYNYAQTVTGPGHASVYTGSTPALHGIIGNAWYDKDLKKEVNCVNDTTRKAVGSEENNGAVSPWRLLTTTITDELKLATQKRAKVIGLSFKDRGAVLPGGHMADGAYWYDFKTGHMITSSYYMDKLPAWVEAFNKQGLPDKYLSQVWNTMYPIEQYIESGKDDTPYESKARGKDKSTFPYDLKELRKQNGDYGMLASTPFGNDFLTEMAKASLDGEKLGQGSETDFLAISYSTPDIIGHGFGPNAVEVEDTYIRLDKNLEDLLKRLDEKVGAGNYTVFITADHGVADVAQYLTDNRIPSGYFNAGKAKANLIDYLKKYFPDKNLLEHFDEHNIFFSNDLQQNNPRSSGVDMLIASELIVKYMLTMEGVANVYTESILRQGRYDEQGIKGMAIRGYHPKRSGDLIFVLEPGWYMAGRIQGTTHGSPYTYDTSVPMLFYGAGIKKGTSVRYHPITDIAPTISVLLDIKFPNGCTGQPVVELFE